MDNYQSRYYAVYKKTHNFSKACLGVVLFGFFLTLAAIVIGIVDEALFANDVMYGEYNNYQNTTQNFTLYNNLYIVAIAFAATAAFFWIPVFVLSILVAVEIAKLPESAPHRSVIMAGGIVTAIFSFSIVGLIMIAIANSKANKGELACQNLVLTPSSTPKEQPGGGFQNAMYTQPQPKPDYNNRQNYSENHPEFKSQNNYNFIGNLPREVFINTSRDQRPEIKFVTSDDSQIQSYNPPVMINNPTGIVFIVKTPNLKPIVHLIFEDGSQENVYN